MGPNGETTDTSFAAFKFTSDARGSKRAEGWSSEGLQLFNKLFDAIATQRKSVETGSKFETDFMLYNDAAANQQVNQHFSSPLRNDWGDRAQYEVVTAPSHCLFEV